MKLDHFLTSHTKINSKWIKDLNIRPETIKLLEENIGKTLSDINHSRILYDPPPRILEIKAKINKWDLFKINCFHCLVAQLCPTLCDPVDCSPPGSSVHGIFQARILEWLLPFPSPGDLPNPGIEPRSPTLQADALTPEPPGKPTRVDGGAINDIKSTRGGGS